MKKSGLLEIIEARESLDSIGGLNVLKDWLLKRRNAFTQRAAAYGLPPAKGLLIIGHRRHGQIAVGESGGARV